MTNIASIPIDYRSRVALCANPDCPRPGRRFVKTNRNHRYCSDECRNAVAFGERICAGCGRRFIPTHAGQLYHSRECYERSAN